MKRMPTILGALFALYLIASCVAEQKFQSGPYSGFTKLDREQVIVEIGKPLHVSEVSGVVKSADKQVPMPKVLFELRDDLTGKVVATKTDSDGRFHLKKIHDGKYTFKATCKGYQSVSGTMVVRAKAAQADSVDINMPQQLQQANSSSR